MVTILSWSDATGDEGEACLEHTWLAWPLLTLRNAGLIIDRGYSYP